MMSKTIEVIFSSTQNYISYYAVLGRSIADKIGDQKLIIHILFTRSVKPMSARQWFKEKRLFVNTFSDTPWVSVEFHDVTKFMHLLHGQNVGMWGDSTSLTHYVYLLAPLVLRNTKQAIYMDGDMICNTDLSNVFDIDMSGKLIAMVEHSGGDDISEKELSPTASNSGFLILNLTEWRSNNTLYDILEFGRHLHKTSFCDQALLYYYFAENHPDKIMYLDKLYNIFPNAHPEIPVHEIKVLHFTSFLDPKPWRSFNPGRGAELWWKYARQTQFYIRFIDDIKYVHVTHAPKGCSLRRLWRHIRTFKF